MKIKNNSISRDPFYSIFVLPAIVNLWFNGKDLTSVGNIVMPTPSALRIGKPSKRYRANSSHLRQQRYIDNSVSRNDNFDKFTLFRDERSEDKLSLSCTFVDFFLTWTVLWYIYTDFVLNFKEVTFSFKRSNCGPDIINVLCLKTTCVINQTIRRGSFWEKSLNLCFIVRFVVEIHCLSFTSFWPEILRNFDCAYLICMKRKDGSTEIYNKIGTWHDRV